MNELKILLWNLQDFFVFLDKYDEKTPIEELSEAKWQLLTTSFKPNKELSKVQGIQKLINSTKPDILLFTEVGGKESLINFNKYFLNEEYTIFHFNSNSDRGIDVGVMAKISPKLKIKSKFYAHKDFARGLQEVLVETKDKAFKIFLTHLKSKLDLKKTDFEGRSHRKKEVDRIVTIINKSAKDVDGHYLLCGDFNGIISDKETEEELRPLLNTLKTQDILNFLEKKDFEKTTYIYFDKRDDSFHMQLDYCLIPTNMEAYIRPQTSIIDFDGRSDILFPLSRKEKQRLISDHYPMLIKLAI